MRGANFVGLSARKLGSGTFRLIAAALLCGSAPSLAQQNSALALQTLPALVPASTSPTLAPALVTSSALPSAPAVEVYYQLRGNAPIWFRDGSTAEAAKLLPAILRRGPLDGLANGPDLARMVEAALVRAQSPTPTTATATASAKLSPHFAEEKLLSAAWVQYVRSLKAPIPGMAYGDTALAPKLPTPERVLIDAGKAPSLLQHVQAVAAVNPLYAQLRDAAWSQSQFGALAPDPRVIANLERARIMPPTGRYILVNAATAQLSMYQDGQVVGTMKVIVGKRGTQTPLIAGTIHYVTFNPYWNIPTDVARRTVAPLVVKRGVSYLRTARYEVTADWTPGGAPIEPDTIDWKAVVAGTADVHLRQLPGPRNMMGAMKFGFVNDLGIYLHDTPNMGLFAKARRNFSLGCVRVEDAKRLAHWFLGKEPVAPSTEPEQNVQMPQGVPVFITYLTARADGGQLAFADDIYGLDPRAEALTDVKLVTAPAGTATVDVNLAPVPASAATTDVKLATAPATTPVSTTATPASDPAPSTNQ